MSADKRNFGLDLVRAVAIALVLVSHLANPLHFLGPLGVDLFFVLSGYLIGGILLRQVIKQDGFSVPMLTRFWHRRWMRTVPNYALFLVLYVVYAYVKSGSLPGSFWQYPLFLQNLAWPCPPFFQVSWSLAVEEWFYLSFPVFFLVLHRCGLNWRTSFQATTGLFLVAPIMARVFFHSWSDWDEEMRKVVVFRLDSMMMGVTLAILQERRPALWQWCKRVWPVGLALFAACVFWGAKAKASGPVHLPAWLFLALAPLGCMLLLPRCTTLLRPPEWIAVWVQRLSEWSYSIYLSHTLIMLIVYENAAPWLKSAPAKLVGKAFIVAATLAVSAALYRWFEKPIMNLRKA